MTGKQLKRWRGMLGLTLEELGDLVGVTRAHICKLENREAGERDIPSAIEEKTLKALEALGGGREKDVLQARQEISDYRVACGEGEG